MTQLVIDPVGEDSKRDANLWSSQTHTWGIAHRVHEVFDQLSQLLVERLDRGCWGPKYGITENTNRLNGHAQIVGAITVRAARVDP